MMVKVRARRGGICSALMCLPDRVRPLPGPLSLLHLKVCRWIGRVMNVMYSDLLVNRRIPFANIQSWNIAQWGNTY